MSLLFGLGTGLGMIPTPARPVPSGPPVNNVLPSLPRPWTQGQSVTASAGEWGGLPSGAFQYKKQRWNGSSWVDVGSFSSSATIAFDSSDFAAGSNGVRLAVSATNDAGTTIAYSAPITIASPLALTGIAPDGVVATSYTFTPTSTGGRSPKTYTFVGSLPSGLVFSESTGAITGTPLSSSMATGLNIIVTDADGLTAPLGVFDIVISVGAGDAPAWLTGFTVLGDINVQNSLLTPETVLIPTNGWAVRIETSLGGRPVLDVSKMLITVRDYGWAKDGTATYYDRTIRATERIFKGYPDETHFTDEDRAAGTVEYALDSSIYNQAATDSTGRTYKTQILSVHFDANAMNGSSAAGAITESSVTRLDSDAYPIPIGSHTEDPMQVMGPSGSISLGWTFVHKHAQQGQQVACVEAWIRRSGVDSASVTRASSMTESIYTATDSISGLTYPEFRTVLTASDLADGDCSVRSRVKPWIGPEVNSYDTDVGAVWSTAQDVSWLADFPIYKDVAGIVYNPVYGYVNQDPTVGLDGTSLAGLSVSSTADPGPSLSYKTLRQHAIAVRTFNANIRGTTSAHRHDDCDAGVAMLRNVAGSTRGQNANSYSTGGVALTGTTTKVPYEIRAASGVTSDLVRIRGVLADGSTITTANKTIGMTKVRFRNITFDSTNTSASTTDGYALYWNGFVGTSSPTVAANYQWYTFHDCSMHSHSDAAACKVLGATLVNYYYRCDMNSVAPRAGFVGWAGTAALVGCNVTGSGGYDGVRMLGSFIKNGLFGATQLPTNLGTRTVKQYVMYNSRVDTTYASPGPASGFGSEGFRAYEMIGIGLCGNIWGRYDWHPSLANALAYAAGDNSVNIVKNWVVQNHSNAGSQDDMQEHRWDTLYQERGFVFISKRATYRFSVFPEFASKPSRFNDDGVDSVSIPLPAHNSANAYYQGALVRFGSNGSVAGGDICYQARSTRIPAGVGLSDVDPLTGQTYWFNAGTWGAAAIGSQPRRTGNYEFRYGVDNLGCVSGSTYIPGGADLTISPTSWFTTIAWPGTANWGLDDPDDYYVDDRTGFGQSAQVGLGSFRPNPLGPLMGRRPAGLAVDPFDQLGTARDDTIAGAAGALEIIPDTTPDAFSFTDATGADLSTLTASLPITVAGITVATPISITGGQYRINGGSWTSSAGNVYLADTVEARGTSSGSYSTAVNVVVTIGGVSDTFTITTQAAGSVPVISVAPAITGMNSAGTADPGQVLTVSTGTWSGSPSSYAYQWKLAGSNVGTNTNTYTPTDVSDASKAITCQVTATNGNGASSPATSNSVDTFHPLQLSPVVFLDAEKASSLTLAGATVTAWAPQGSGGGNLVVNSTDDVLAVGPDYSATGLNGRPAVTGNGTTQYLEAKSGTGTLPTGIPVSTAAAELWGLVSSPDISSVTTARTFFGHGNTGTSGTRARELSRVRLTSPTTASRFRVTGGTAAGAITSDNTTVSFEGIHLVRGVFGSNTVDAICDSTSGSVPTATTLAILAARLRVLASPTNNAGANTRPANYSTASINFVAIFSGSLASGPAQSMTRWGNLRGGL